MRRARLWLAALVVAGACTGGGAGEQDLVGRPEAGWPAIASSLVERPTASSPNVCNRGEAACLDAVLDEMSVRLDRQVGTCDHRAAFSLSYLFTTRGLRDAARTADPAAAQYLVHLDAVYARMYFEVVDAWDGGRMTAVPAAWQRAFDAAARRQITGLGDLLAAMNAHITRDLAFVVAAVGLTLADGRSAKPAFDLVNGVLAAVQQPMIDELSRRLDPTVALVDLSRIAPAGATVTQLLAGWRDEAWINAGRLAAASAADRPAVEASIDGAADARGLSIILATSYIPFVSSTATRDQFCMVNGRR